MISPNFLSSNLKDIVIEDFHTAAVFEKYALDFCCHGGKTIDEACREKGIEASSVLSELENLNVKSEDSSPRFGDWDSDFLIDYIVKNHHSFVSRMIPVLRTHTQKIASVHGARHPEVIKIADHFNTVANDLQQHMQKEEVVLFPFIKELARAKKAGQNTVRPPFGTVGNPIRMMEAEHQAAGDEMNAIRKLSNSYTVPEDACTTYRVTYQELHDFEMDLHQHVHLENNILFPKAILLESELLSTN
ncbi:MAG: iron-sulfur cluster repair di-iron protein [Bacteroidota bacterium]